jgi:dTDP-glucose 4,6-dehydratase
MKKALVLGSNSFLGQHTVTSLVNSGYEVLGISRSTLIEPLSNIDNFSFVMCDINTEFNKLKLIMDTFKPNIIVNFIAQCMVAQSWDHPDDYFQTNTVSLTRIVKHLINKDYLDKLIQTSTPENYGNISNAFKESRNYNPTTPYGCSKAAFDMYLHMVYDRFKFPSVIIRTANIYGPHQQLYRIIPKTVIKIKKQEKLPLDGGGKSKRYFLYESDLTNGIHTLIDKGISGEIYHLSGLDYISIHDLVFKICENMNYDFNKLVYLAPDRLGKDDEYAIDSSKAKKELGWEPKVSLDAGLNSTISWINNDWEKIKNKSCEYIYKV